jgi:hypothetical protein
MEATAPNMPRTRRRSAMKYLLLIYSNEAAAKTAPRSETEKMLAAYGAYTEAMQRADVMLSGHRLQPSSVASIVRVVDGKSEVLDGPYADTKEQLGGYYLIEVPDLDAALAWAARCPGASRGRIEVRPLWAN